MWFIQSCGYATLPQTSLWSVIAEKEFHYKNDDFKCCCSDHVRNILIAFPISTQWVLLNLPTIHKTDWRITLLTANGLVKNSRNSLVSQLFTLMTSFQIILSHSSPQTKSFNMLSSQIIFSFIFKKPDLNWNWTELNIHNRSE